MHRPAQHSFACQKLAASPPRDTVYDALSLGLKWFDLPLDNKSGITVSAINALCLPLPAHSTEMLVSIL